MSSGDTFLMLAVRRGLTTIDLLSGKLELESLELRIFSLPLSIGVQSAEVNTRDEGLSQKKEDTPLHTDTRHVSYYGY